MKTQTEEQTNVSHHCPVCDLRLPDDPVLSFSDDDCPECGYYLWCRKKTEDDVAVLSVLPDRTPEQTEIVDLVDLLARDEGIPRVVVDLSHLEAVPSLFLGRLPVLHKQIQHHKGALILCGLNQHFHETFAFTGLDSLLNVAIDEKAALASLGKRSSNSAELHL